MSIYFCENQIISPNIKNETQMQQILEVCTLCTCHEISQVAPPPISCFHPSQFYKKMLGLGKKIEVWCFATQAFVIEQFLFMFIEVCNNAIPGL
jgi:hypothetical protein